jgi:hypothetical protein
LIDPLGLCKAKKAWNAIKDKVNIFSDYISQLVKDFIGTKPGDIFTIGFAGSPFKKIPLGFAVSFDRVVMPDGQVDWFVTGGVGMSSPSSWSFSADRGKVWKQEITTDKDRLKSKNKRDWYDMTHNFTKGDIKGFSISTNIDIIGKQKLGVGGEAVYTPFSKSKIGNLDYDAPLITFKGGPRAGSGTGGNIMFNWTIDL